MNQPTKYKSIQELKSSSKPADSSSEKSMERYENFERSMKSLRKAYIEAGSNEK